MAELFTDDWKANAAKTRDDILAFGEEPLGWYTADELITYLEENPRHAVVIFAATDNLQDITFEPPVYVLRGASEKPDDYYRGEYPPEDSNDGTPATSAETALSEAVGEYYE